MSSAREGVGKVVTLVSGGHFISHYFLLAFPPLFPLLAGEFQLSNTELGALVSAIMFPVLVLQIPVGELVDRVGAKPVFVLGIAVTSLGVLFAGLADSYLLLIGAALVSGIGQSTFHPADYTLLEAVVGEDQEGKAYSVHTFGGYAGFAAAPVIIGTLGISIGWRPALLISGVAGIFYATLAQFGMESGHDRQIRTANSGQINLSERMRVLLTPSLVALAGLYLLLFVIVTGIQSFTVVFVDQGLGLGTAVGNTALTAFTVASAIGVLVGGPLADRFDIYRMAGVGYLLCGASTILVASEFLPPTTVYAVVLLGLIGLLFGVPLPARDRLVSSYAPLDATGRSFGLVFTGGYIGSFVAPLFLGSIIDSYSPAVAFAVIAGLFAFCICIVIGLDVFPSETGDSGERSVNQ